MLVSFRVAESVNDFVAGWVGGVAGIIVGSPLDVLKARLQAPKTVTAGARNEPLPTAWQTLRRLVHYEGISSLFKGILAPVVGLAGLNAILFVSYGGLIRMFERQYKAACLDSDQPPFVPTLSQVYVAGCGAGIAGFFFSTPTELIKIQAQMSRLPKSSWQVTKEIFARNGLRGYYQGGWITMIRDAPSYGIYFWVYEGMKRLLEIDQAQGASGSNVWKLLTAGGMAGAVSWGSIYPIDVVKSRLQMQVVESPRQVMHRGFSAIPTVTTYIKPAALQQAREYGSRSGITASSDGRIALDGHQDRPYTSIRDCVLRSYRADGISVFFRGLGPTLFRAFPVNAVTFFTYEIMMDALEGL
ncbi:mitochondrial carrier domain-containing protein [Dichotomocladium elegans]|nr:mitochondrial carrier domain-containing protein [Dichotomocladium elegans]